MCCSPNRAPAGCCRPAPGESRCWRPAWTPRSGSPSHPTVRPWSPRRVRAAWSHSADAAGTGGRRIALSARHLRARRTALRRRHRGQDASSRSTSRPAAAGSSRPAYRSVRRPGSHPNHSRDAALPDRRARSPGSRPAPTAPSSSRPTAEGSVPRDPAAGLICPNCRGPTTDHRYIQVARALAQGEIVDGVYPVGSAATDRTRAVPALLRQQVHGAGGAAPAAEDNLVSSRPRAGTMSRARRPRTARRPGRHVDQRSARLRDRGPVRHRESIAMRSPSTASWPPEPVCRSARKWLAVVGFRRAEDSDVPICRTEYHINRSFSRRWAGCCRTTPGRSSRSWRTLPGSASWRCAERSPPCSSPRTGPECSKVELGSLRCRCSAATPPPTPRSPQVTVNTIRQRPSSSFHDDATGEGLSRCCPPCQLDSGRAAEAYRSGLDLGTLADSLRDAAQAAPGREILVDGPVRLDCRSCTIARLHWRPRCWRAIPVGSVVSFMLPNWHEAAIVYHAATLAGMVVNPILPYAARPRTRLHPDRRRRADDVRARRVRRPRLPAMLARGDGDHGGTASGVVVVRGEPTPGQTDPRRCPAPTPTAGRSSTPTRCG